MDTHLPFVFLCGGGEERREPMETPLGYIQVGCGQHRHLVYKEGEKGSWGVHSAGFLVDTFAVWDHQSFHLRSLHGGALRCFPHS